MFAIPSLLRVRSDRQENSVSVAADSNQEVVRKRAYQIWEEEGHLPNRDLQNWLRAESEVLTIAQTARGLDGSRKAIEDAALIGSGLWLSYIFVLFYVAVSVSGVTHIDLFVQNTVKLPFLNVELPLLEFFAVIPIVFVIMHAYTLVHFVMLGAKAGHYDQALGDHLPFSEAIQETLRQQLPNNIFLQFMAGPKEVREGGLGYILKVIAWTTLALGPILLILLIQIRFLPFHRTMITWEHRLILLLDLALIWVLWTAVLSSRGRLLWPRLTASKKALVATIVIVGFSWFAATFPGERQSSLLKIPIVTRTTEGENVISWMSVSDILFHGDLDPTGRRRTSIFSNTLELTGFNILESQKIDDLEKVGLRQSLLDLSDRDLTGATLANVNLTKVDLRRAQVSEASLIGARLPGANLYGAILQGANLGSAQLPGASLYRADLRGAVMGSVGLQGAWLDQADLADASMVNAQLQGASLVGANLQRVSFLGAHLEGASLRNAGLDGASFFNTFVWMADIEGATERNVHVAAHGGLVPSPCQQKDVDYVCTYDAIKTLIVQKVPPGILKDAALSQIERQLGARKRADADEIGKMWENLRPSP
jgi:uncharacterized protein YjbI with pentapeptide repeats